jgi:hypothetical protein
MRRTLHEIRRWLTRDLRAMATRQLLLLGSMQAQRVRSLPYPPAPVDPPCDRLHACEFSVFSQWGEDGILQYLLHHVPIRHRTFIEFGVEDYQEANTRFLLLQDNWSGFVLDGSPAHLASIRGDALFWRRDLQARAAFVTRENIDTLLAECGFDSDLGLLSIDVDGNDYWLWEAMSGFQPRVVSCEYNPLFGHEPVCVPYDPGFRRLDAHHSGLYYGASLAALAHLGRARGYVLAGADSSGTNAYFVRADLAPPGLAIEPHAAYVSSTIRQSRDRAGHLTFARRHEQFSLIAGLPVIDVTTGERHPLVEAGR